jgi:Ca2+-binding RTX toxin-like protein
MANVFGTDNPETLDANDGVTNGADSIFGLGGDDIIFGLGGNDELKGGGGADTLNGGSGTDTANYSDSATGVTVSLETGLGFGGTAEGDTLTSIENLTGSAQDDFLVGNGGANVLTGLEDNDILKGGGGADTLYGDSGNDTLKGGGGADTLNGGSGIDTAAYNDSGAGVFISLITDDASGGDAEGDELNSIENVTGSAFSDNLWGHDGVNRLSGLDGNDILKGYGGADELLGGDGDDSLLGMDGDDTLRGEADNDTLNGGNGSDEMRGGTGNDIYIVAEAGDQTIEASGEGTDTVRSSVSWTLASNVERLELQGAGNLNGTGNTLANTLVGNASNNLLNGHAGNDWMVGGAGDDIFVVAAAGDNTIEAAGQGTDTIRSYIDRTLANNVERLELQGAGNLNGTGNTLNNTLVGNSGNNSLNGGDGNDFISAGAGNDTLVGGAGNDTLIGAAGSDTLNGGTGNDRFDFDLVSHSPAGPALRDSIVGGFAHGFDLIDLATIDANTLAGGDQAFSFIGSAAFSGAAGQLRYSNYSGTVIIDADVNGDSTADMQILVAGTNFMTGTDFIV